MQFQLITLTCLALVVSLAESAKRPERGEDSDKVGNYEAGDSQAEGEYSGAGEQQQQQQHQHHEAAGYKDEPVHLAPDLKNFGGDFLGNLLGGKKVAPPPAAAAGVDFFGLKLPSDQKAISKGFTDLTKLIFNPYELVRSICAHFKIPMDKIVEKLGKSSILGIEALLYPLVASMKIVEKVFVPDACRLKFICKMGRHLDFVRESVLKFSPNFLEGSVQIKALSEGIVGHDCEKVFEKCEPKLQKTYEDLKVGSGGSEHQYGEEKQQQQQGDSSYGARGLDAGRPIGGVLDSTPAGQKQPARTNQAAKTLTLSSSSQQQQQQLQQSNSAATIRQQPLVSA